MNINIYNAPELEWLKANSINGTPEGVDTVDKEFQRTWCSIMLLNAVLENDYEGFSNCQPEETRITQQSFCRIRDYVKSVLKTKDDEDAMRAYLIINDLGKVEDFVHKIAETVGVESVDHDKILYEGLNAHPEFSPTFSALDEKYQKLILIGLKTMFNMGQYVQCECLPANLVPLLDIDLYSFEFYIVHVLFYIAGVAGHVNPNGSIIFNEFYWKRFSAALETILHMIRTHDDGGVMQVEVLYRGYSQIIDSRIHETYGPEDAYNEYLERTRRLLEIDDGYLIVKLCNLIRVSTVKEAEEVRQAYYNLDSWVKTILNKELRATGIGLDSGVRLYYTPATFQNALSFYKKKDPDTAIMKTFQVIAPLIAQIYADVRHEWSGDNGYIVAFIADVAKAAMNPDKLSEVKLVMKKVGNDFKFIVDDKKSE